MVMSAVSSVSTPGVFVHQDTVLLGRGEVDVIDAGAEARDQLEVRAGVGR